MIVLTSHHHKKKKIFKKTLKIFSRYPMAIENRTWFCFLLIYVYSNIWMKPNSWLRRSSSRPLVILTLVSKGQTLHFVIVNVLSMNRLNIYCARKAVLLVRPACRRSQDMSVISGSSGISLNIWESSLWCVTDTSWTIWNLLLQIIGSSWITNTKMAPIAPLGTKMVRSKVILSKKRVPYARFCTSTATFNPHGNPTY